MGKGDGRGERRRAARRRRAHHRRRVHRRRVQRRRHHHHHGRSVFISGGQPMKCHPCAFIFTLLCFFAMVVGGLMVGLGAPSNISLLVPGGIGLVGGFFGFFVIFKLRQQGHHCFVQTQGSSAANSPQTDEVGSVQTITVVSAGGQGQETIMTTLSGENSTGAVDNNWAPPAYPGGPAAPYPNYGASSYPAGVNGNSIGINQPPSYFTPVGGAPCPPPVHLHPQGSTQTQHPPYPSTDRQAFAPTPPPPGLNEETAPPSYDEVMQGTGGYTLEESRPTNQAPVPDTVLDVD